MAWQRKDGRIARRRAEILIDLRFRDTAPVRDLPMLHWLGVWCRQPVQRERFVPAAEQATVLRIERKLKTLARKASNGWAVYVMRIVSEGLVQYFFYARGAGALDGVSAELRKSFPRYRFEHDSEPDAEWVEYLDRSK